MSNFTTSQFIAFIIAQSEFSFAYCEWSQALYFSNGAASIYFNPNIEFSEVELQEGSLRLDVGDTMEATLEAFELLFANTLFSIAA